MLVTVQAYKLIKSNKEGFKTRINEESHWFLCYFVRFNSLHGLHGLRGLRGMLGKGLRQLFRDHGRIRKKNLDAEN